MSDMKDAIGVLLAGGQGAQLVAVVDRHVDLLVHRSSAFVPARPSGCEGRHNRQRAPSRSAVTAVTGGLPGRPIGGQCLWPLDTAGSAGPRWRLFNRIPPFARASDCTSPALGGIRFNREEGRLKVFAIVGTVILVVVAAAGTLVSGGASVASAVADSNRVLRSVGTHSKQVAASLQAPELGMTGAGDVQAEKRQVDEYLAGLDQATATVGADRSALAASRGKLDGVAGSPTTLPFRQPLQSQHDRVGSAIAALDAAAGALQVEHDQGRTLAAAMDALGDFAPIMSAMKRSDYAGALAGIPGMQSKLATAITLSRTPSNPPQVQKLLVDLQTLMTDTLLPGCTGVLVLADGTVLQGIGVGATGHAVG